MLAKAHLDLRLSLNEPPITRTRADTENDQSLTGKCRSDDWDDELALLRWADDGGYCPPDPGDIDQVPPATAILRSEGQR